MGNIKDRFIKSVFYYLIFTNFSLIISPAINLTDLFVNISVSNIKSFLSPFGNNFLTASISTSTFLFLWLEIGTISAKNDNLLTSLEITDLTKNYKSINNLQIPINNIFDNIQINLRDSNNNNYDFNGVLYIMLSLCCKL